LFAKKLGADVMASSAPEHGQSTGKYAGWEKSKTKGDGEFLLWWFFQSGKRRRKHRSTDLRGTNSGFGRFFELFLHNSGLELLKLLNNQCIYEQNDSEWE